NNTGEIPPDWWKLYRDPTLDELVASVRSRNADLRIAAAQVEEAEAVMRQARSAIFPDVNLNFSRSRSRIGTLTQPPPVSTAPLERNDARLVASTSFEIDFWGRVRRAGEAADANLLGTRLRREVVTLTLGGLTAQTYFGLRSLDAQIAVLDNTIKLRRDSLEIARARASSGLASELDVYQAQGALSDALVQRRDAGRQRALLERQLAQLSGRLDMKVSSGDLFALPVPPTPPAGLPSSLLERRPDVRAAEQTMVAANAQIGAARAARFPTVTLTGFLGGQSAAVEDIASSGVWSLGLGVVAPIFDAGRREAVEDQAAARYRQTLASWQKSVEGAFREVSDALVNFEETSNSEADLLERVKAARQALELSQIRYESGYSPYLEVLDAQRTANDAEIAFVRNRQARLAFSVDLMRALGGGWAEKN
ncbi:MAG TPA: efflux transporter outer membrane subunit, partial [Burkholderiales bacterium]|nr:efflux transporter outer membrane subunit [Burkholderiales bacterium]